MSRWIVCGLEPGKDECTTLTVAVKLAMTIGARLALVAVVPDTGDKEAESLGRRTLGEAARRCRVPDDAVHRVERGSPADGLERAAHELDAEFLVVGESRQRGFARRFARTVERKLTQKSRRPVVVVSEGSAATFARYPGLANTVARGLGSRDGGPGWSGAW